MSKYYDLNDPGGASDYLYDYARKHGSMAGAEQADTGSAFVNSLSIGLGTLQHSSDRQDRENQAAASTQDTTSTYSSSSGTTSGSGGFIFSLLIILSMIFGAYDNITNGNGPIDSALKAGGTAYLIPASIGDKIRDIDHDSTITAIGNGIFKLIGFGCGIYAGFGAGFGNGIVWVFRFIGGGSNKSVTANQTINTNVAKSEGRAQPNSSEVFTGNVIVANTAQLNVRSGPGPHYDKVGDPLDRGFTVRVIRDIDNGWKEIEFPSSNNKVTRGFVNGKYLVGP